MSKGIGDEKSIVLLLGLSLVLSACGPDEDESKSSKEKTEAQQRDHNKVKEIATDKKCARNRLSNNFAI